MRSIELFSGCGGLALGLSMAGFRHEMMVEWNNDACSTIFHNRRLGVDHVAHWPIRHADVRGIDWSEVGNELHLVAGGPPCQPFSIGGKHTGNEDSRDMWPQAIRAVRELMPNGFVFENVKGLLRPVFSDYLNWITSHLALPHLERAENETYQEHLIRLGRNLDEAVYDVRILKVNAADYGVAQKRHRVIIFGVRRDLNIPITLLQPTHSRERLLWDQWVTGHYWARHGISVPPDSQIPTSDNLMVQKLRKQNTPPAHSPWATVRDALHGLGEPNGKMNHNLQEGARVYTGHTGCPLDQPAKALKAGAHGVPGGENMMVRDDGTVRYFTVREAARLQGLPDEYTFPGSWTESMRQLGNAVPVKLAQAVGNMMATMLEQDEAILFRNAA
ncbi:MAG: DNA (cytosine-5-)-methyltransferase [Desulfobacteraceae bacterium]|nr:DNA (cytosine-5-)-methyltransferase [Desulfobacteraceae bacterium]